MPNNNSTSKWIAIIVVIVLTISGWTFAGMNAAKVKQVERNTLDIGELKTEYGIISTKLEYIIEDLGEIKEVLKNE